MKAKRKSRTRSKRPSSSSSEVGEVILPEDSMHINIGKTIFFADKLYHSRAYTQVYR